MHSPQRLGRSLKFRTIRLINRLRSRMSKKNENNQVSKYDRFVDAVVANCGRIAGKAVLEIGSDSDGRMLRLLTEKFDAARAIGVNPILSQRHDEDRWSLRPDDARDMDLDDDSIDMVMSISVLEHVRDLPEVLTEIYRVLKPGGYLFTEFGPIWSSAWGHHLWITHQGRVCNWRTHPLPAYAHLLMSEPELNRWCADQFDDASLADAICEFVYRSPEQNRLFYDDYQTIFQDSAFELVCMTGMADFPLPPAYADGNAHKIYQRLKVAHPDHSGFGYHVVSACLYKPPVGKTHAAKSPHQN